VFLAIRSAGDFIFFQYTFDTLVHETIHFKSASTTKLFMEASILLFYQQGKLNIEDRITDLIPGRDSTYIPLTSNYAAPYRDEITIRQLQGHHAGVFDVTNDNMPVTISAPYIGIRCV
jgi:D-alanyl-D-alanine carboxypeptidase